jgi:hypothetical protein
MVAIRDFAGHRQVRDWDHSTAARVREEYQAAGYYPVKCPLQGRAGEWQDIHRWCCEHMGKDHYSWTGSTFWFENERDAILFTLRWGS